VYVLTNWKIVSCVSSSGAVMTGLRGNVFGNPRFSSGELIQTSTVRNHRIEFDSLIVVTRNGSEYWMGKPDPAESFAMQRLLRYLQESESVQLGADAAEPTRMAAGSATSHSHRTAALQNSAANPTGYSRRATDRERSGGPGDRAAGVGA
jgi:hypothetical protein